MALVYEAKSATWAAQPGICNSNNHPADITTEEYKRRIALTYKNEWIRSFPDPDGTITISLSLAQCRMLAEAAYCGSITDRRPEMYEEELLAVEAMIADAMKGSSIEKWFVRLNEASPKDGKFGCGPLRSAADIVTSLATSMRARRALLTMTQMEKGDTLYLVPWQKDWNEGNEFRVFVYNRKVTAISQYVWHKDVGWSQDGLKGVAPEILSYCNETIIPKMMIDSFVVDVIIVSPGDSAEFHVELVEFNSFGAELASGAALFHWLNDYDTLYGNGDTVVVRYVTN